MQKISLILLSLLLATSPALAANKNIAPKVPNLKAMKFNITAKAPRIDNGINIDCIEAAIVKRDGAISAALDKEALGLQTALKNRLNSILAAWDGNSSQRSRLIRDAWKKFQSDKQALNKTQLADNHNAWKIYYTERKACGGNAAQEDPTTEAVDNL